MDHKIITVKKDGLVDIENFSDFLDTTKIHYYSIKSTKDMAAVIRFYDKNRKLIKISGKKS